MRKELQIVCKSLGKLACRSVQLALVSMVVSLGAIPVVAQSGPFVVLIGAPGSGKSTQSEAIATKYGVPHVNMGELVTSQVERVTKQNQNRSTYQRRNSPVVSMQAMQAAAKKLAAGELVADAELDSVVASRIFEPDCKGGFVLDGYPASEAQADFLDELMSTRDLGPVTVIHLKLSDEAALKRMKKRGRTDDKAGMAEERLKQFNAQSADLARYYEGGDFFQVDGSKAPAEVTKEIVAVLDKRK